MNHFTTSDGTEIFFKDWGERDARPVVLSHGWPLNADAWDRQARLVAEHGYRAVVHDRRGHGRSGQPWHGNDMNTYADDLAELIDTLGLRNAVLVGHSTGGGEITRYMGRHGTDRVSKAVLLGAVPPLMLRTEINQEGTPVEIFDGLREGLLRDRSQFYLDLSESFFGANRPGSTVSQGLRHAFWQQSMACGLKAAYDCVRQFSETDFTEDLRRIDVPLFVAHGDDDQIVPVAASARKTAVLVKDADLKIYPGAPHGLSGAFEEEFEADLLRFLAG
ncbi:alpha/beta fold hydrolase [Streptomyces sp. NPDC048172]|uniref:alpha/beta fold hydrolase n=1 Tax=Streptomyces sp. NPDC048172 TaxID=3365505 RepID=UPI00371F5C5C